MLRAIKLKYFAWRKAQAVEAMDLTRGIHNATHAQLQNNISYRIAKAKRDYYALRLQFYY